MVVLLVVVVLLYSAQSLDHCLHELSLYGQELLKVRSIIAILVVLIATSSVSSSANHLIE